jgi:hypothetical protein
VRHIHKVCRMPKVNEQGWRSITRMKKKPAWSHMELKPSFQAGKVPVDLIGLCFNCFSGDHITKTCPNRRAASSVVSPTTRHKIAPSRGMWPVAVAKPGVSGRHQPQQGHHRCPPTPIAIMLPSPHPWGLSLVPSSSMSHSPGSIDHTPKAHRAPQGATWNLPLSVVLQASHPRI